MLIHKYCLQQNTSHSHTQNTSLILMWSCNAPFVCCVARNHKFKWLFEVKEGFFSNWLKLVVRHFSCDGWRKGMHSVNESWDQKIKFLALPVISLLPLLILLLFLKHGHLFKADSVDYQGHTDCSDIVPPTPAFPVSPPTPYGTLSSQDGHSWIRHFRYLIQCLLSLPRFPTQDWHTAGQTQLDTRYTSICMFVCSFILMWLCPNTQCPGCCPTGLKRRLECPLGIIHQQHTYTHTHTWPLLCCYWLAMWARVCFWLVTSGYRQTDVFSLDFVLIIFRFVVKSGWGS